MELHAEWAVHGEDDEPVDRNGAERMEGRVVLEPVNRFPRDHIVGLERRGGLIPARVREVSMLEAITLTLPNA